MEKRLADKDVIIGLMGQKDKNQPQNIQTRSFGNSIRNRNDTTLENPPTA